MRLLPFAVALAGLAACSARSGTGSSVVPPWDGKPPPATCAPPVALRDVSSPAAVVGDGTPASCAEAALREKAGALDAGGGGTLVFDCGPDPITIRLSSQLVFTHDTLLDGGGLVTLSGGGTTRILYLDSGYDRTTPRLWVQRLTFAAGASAREAGGDTASGGAAIYRDGGSLTVVGCAFLGNHAPSTGPDLAGGAIYAFGGGDTVVVGSTFVGNSASDGGAIGSLNGELTVVNSTFTGNEATGTGGNPGDGGCGGALYQDGADEATNLCGVTIRGNRAGAIGGGVFRVSNTGDGTMAVDLSALDANEVTAEGEGDAGGAYLQGLALTVTRTTVSRNRAWYGGGLWISKGTVQLADSTVAGNEATVNGGGLWLAYSPPGAILNCTIADNRSVGADTVAGAVFGAGPTLVNTIVSGNTAPWSPGCSDRLADGGGNLEWPAGAGCAAGTVADPLLGPLADNGGATETVLPAAASPARGLGTGSCPAVDQRGVARATPCTAGAVEVP